MTARQVLRAVVKAFLAELGQDKKPNPWPKCRLCFRRVDPLALCVACRACESTCCIRCDPCGQCIRACRGHDHEKELS